MSAGDDETLDGVRRALSVADAADDPRWLDVAEGRLDPLDAAAEVGGDCGALPVLFAPLDGGVLDRIEQAIAGPSATAVAEDDPILAGLDRALADGGGDEDLDDPRLAALISPPDAAALDRIERAVEPKKDNGAKILQFPRRGVIGAVLAAAAAALLWVLPRGEAPLYAAELSAGDQAVRGEPADAVTPTFRADSTLTLILRPATATEAPPVSIELAAVAGADRWPVTLPMKPSPSGALTYRGPAAPLFVAPAGAYTLRIVVDPAGRAQSIERPIRLEAAP